MKPVFLVLPWPPSVNNYRTTATRHGKITRFLNDEVYAFRAKVLVAVMEAGARGRFGEARIGVSVESWPPTRGKRDSSNYWKCLLDALEHAGLFVNDSQSCDERWVKHGFRGKEQSRIEVTVWALPDEQA